MTPTRLSPSVLAGLAVVTPADDKVSPGLAGFLAVFGLALVTVLLIRSMVGHLRKVRYSPEPPDPDAVVDPAVEQVPPGGAGEPKG